MHTTTELCETTSQRRLPLASLLAFAMTGFIAILTETLPAGLLPQIAEGLGVTQVMAGQLVSIYALGSLLAAIPLTVLTSGWRRKRVLLLAVSTFLIFNTITTLSSSYWLTMGARFMSGVAPDWHGGSWRAMHCVAGSRTGYCYGWHTGGSVTGYASRCMAGQPDGMASALWDHGSPGRDSVYLDMDRGS